MRAKAPMGFFKKLAGAGLGGSLALVLVLQSAHAQDPASTPLDGAQSESLPTTKLNLADDQSPADEGPSQEALKQMVETEGGAVFRGLDKITARVSTVYSPIDEVVSFGSLQFVTRQCNKRPPEETPEKTAFLEVKDIKPDKSEEELFQGWMFASSPALNALEHPVYDIWLIDCIIIEPEVPEGSDENSAG